MLTKTLYYFKRLNNIFLALVFLLSSLLKIISWKEFLVTLKNYEILPDNTLLPLSLVIILLELIISVNLLFGFWPRYTLLTAFLLMVSFISFSAYSMIMEKHWICNCFGSFFATEINFSVLVRDIVIILLIVSSLTENRIVPQKISFEKHLKKIVVTILIMFLCLKIYTEFSVDKKKTIRPGEKMSNMLFEPIKINSQFGIYSRKQDYLLLIFFDINDCAPCLLEANLWQEIHEKFSEHIMVLAVASASSIDAVENFIKHHSISFPVMYDRDKKLMKQFIMITPHRVLLDKNNIILDARRSSHNQQSQQALRDIIESCFNSSRAVVLNKKYGGNYVY